MHQIRFWLPLVTFHGKKCIHLLKMIFTAVVGSFSLLILTYFIFSQAALCIKVNLVNNKMNEVQKRLLFLCMFFLLDQIWDSSVWLWHESYTFHTHQLLTNPHQELFTNIQRAVIRGKSKKLIGIFRRHSMIFVPALAQYFL